MALPGQAGGGEEGEREKKEQEEEIAICFEVWLGLSSSFFFCSNFMDDFLLASFVVVVAVAVLVKKLYCPDFARVSGAVQPHVLSPSPSHKNVCTTTTTTTYI